MSDENEVNKKEENLQVIEKIVKGIVEQTSDGEYIYRGQSGTYRPQSAGDDTFPQVTSTLYRALYRGMEKRYKESDDELRRLKELSESQEWRELFKLQDDLNKRKLQKLREWRDMEHDMNVVQGESLAVARKFASEDCSDKEILSLIQHYSGDTNLIDFTKDYLVALFFACYHKHGVKDGEDGKVFLLKTSKLEGRGIEMITPAHPPNRVIAQKSIFVQSRSGTIPIEDLMEVVNIPLKLKQSILDYLKEHHDIDLSTIYNDLHGYIRNSKEYGDVVMEFYLGLNYNYKSDKAQSPKEKRDAAKKAMGYFEKATQLDPKYTRAFINYGVAKNFCGTAEKELGNEASAMSNYNDAIKYYDKAIALDPKYVHAYNNRGIVKEELGDISGAIRDYDKSIELDPKYVLAYYNRGGAKVNCGDIKKESGDESGTIIDYKDAIRDYDKAIDMDPKYVMAYNNRGNAKVNCGDIKKESGDGSDAIIDYKDAIRDYDKAIDLNPDYVEAYFNRGIGKEMLGGRDNFQQALSDFEKTNELALQQKKESMAGRAQIGIARVTAKIAKMDKS